MDVSKWVKNFSSGTKNSKQSNNNNSCLLEMEGKYAALDTDGTQQLMYVTVGKANLNIKCKGILTSDSLYFLLRLLVLTLTNYTSRFIQMNYEQCSNISPSYHSVINVKWLWLLHVEVLHILIHFMFIHMHAHFCILIFPFDCLNSFL